MTSSNTRARAVNIIQIREGRLEINEPELRQVLAGIPSDAQISVVSVVGAFRTGKSFLLNFFLQFLRSGASRAWHGEKEWMEDFVAANQNAANTQNEQNSAPPPGFDWRGGTDTCTLGIWLWSEHFLRPSLDGEHPVAVLLMDTQGLFDGTLTQTLTTSIFGLSTLISSHQIFNIKDKIQDDHLQHLALFSEYSKLISNGTEAHARSFQHLDFLIRDWADFDPQAAGEDLPQYIESITSEYLASVFAQCANEEVIQVRAQIRSVFDSIACFVLPHPGTHVPNSKFDGSVQRLAPEFRAALSVYVDHVFAKSSRVKLLGGTPVVGGEDLLQLILAYCKLFQAADFPQPQSLYETTVNANNHAALRQAKQVALASLAEFWEQSAGGPLPEQALRDAYARFLAQAQTSLARREMGSEQARLQAHLELESQLARELDQVLVANELRHVQQEQCFALAQKTARERYFQALEEVVTKGGSGSGPVLWEEAALCKEEEAVRKAAWDLFHELTASAGRDAIYYAKYHDALELELQQHFATVLAENAAKHEREKAQLANAVEHAKDVFLAAFMGVGDDLAYLQSDEDFLAQAQVHVERALALFDTLVSKKQISARYTSGYRATLEALLEEEIARVLAGFKLVREEEEVKITAAMEETKSLFATRLKMHHLVGKPWPASVLRAELENVERECLHSFALRAERFAYHLASFTQRVKQELARESVRVMGENAKLVEEKVAVDALEASKLYREEMRAMCCLLERGSGVVDLEFFQRAHMDCASKAHAYFARQLSSIIAPGSNSGEGAAQTHAPLARHIARDYEEIARECDSARAAAQRESWPLWGLNLLPLLGTVKSSVQAGMLWRAGETRSAQAKSKLVEALVSLAVDLVALATAMLAVTSSDNMVYPAGEVTAIATTLRVVGATMCAPRAEAYLSKSEGDAMSETILRAAMEKKDVTGVTKLLLATSGSDAKLVLDGLTWLNTMLEDGKEEDVEGVSKAVVKVLREYGAYEYAICEAACKLLVASAKREVVSELLELGAVDAVTRALRNDYTDSALQALS